MSRKDLEAEVRKELENIRLDEPVSILEKHAAGPSGDAAPEVGGNPCPPSEPMDTVVEASSTSSSGTRAHNTTILFMLGMAGSGKTSWTQRFAAHLLSQKKTPYIVNLDPACEDPPFPVNIDIRDTIDFSKVMTQYGLGPNGAIVTSLNLFATKFDQVIGLIKQRSASHEYILIDTPGQLECFLWSASGQIMLQSLASLFPSIVVYISDLVRCSNPMTFVSNMMYGISILFKNRLPIIITLNKADVDLSHGKRAKEWITDWEKFEEVLRLTPGYTASFSSSIALSLEELYSSVEHVAVSAYDGYGLNDFSAAVNKCVAEYETVYVPMYKRIRESYLKKAEKRKLAEQEAARKVLVEAAPMTPDERRAKASMELFSAPAGPGGGLGFDLMWGNHEDSSSSEEEVLNEDKDEDNPEGSMRDYYSEEAARREQQRNAGLNTPPGPSAP